MTEYTRRQVLRTAGAAAGTAVVAGSLTDPLSAAAVETAGSETNPLQLWYAQPATEWLQALAIGNGRLGAMVFGGTATERLQLNEDTIWAGGPYDQYDIRWAWGAPGDPPADLAEEKYLDAQNLVGREHAWAGRRSRCRTSRWATCC